MKKLEFPSRIFQEGENWVIISKEIPELRVEAPTQDEAFHLFNLLLQKVIGIVKAKLDQIEMKPWEWDVFISYASEDKDEVAAPIFQHLKALGIRVWFDKFEIRLGENWISKIEQGLAQSQYGIFLLSQNFIEKDWPERELKTFIALVKGTENRILPIRHNLSQPDLVKFAPLLASIHNTSTDNGIEDVVRQIMARIEPNNSYYTDGELGIAIKPSRLNLYHGDWRIVANNLIFIQNTTINPIYAIELEIRLYSDDLTLDDIEMTGLGNFSLSSPDKKWLQTQLSILPPLSYKAIEIKTKKATSDANSRIEFRISSYKNTPSPMLGK